MHAWGVPCYVVLGQGAFGKALLVSRKSDGAELAMKQMAYSAMSSVDGACTQR